MNPQKIQDDYELFMENDFELASKYGNDIDFLKRNNAELRWETNGFKKNIANKNGKIFSYYLFANR